MQPSCYGTSGTFLRKVPPQPPLRGIILRDTLNMPLISPTKITLSPMRKQIRELQVRRAEKSAHGMISSGPPHRALRAA
jgi:hypothetical protein